MSLMFSLRFVLWLSVLCTDDLKERRWSVGSGYHTKGAVHPYSWAIPEAMMHGRRDLRVTHRDAVVSIDPIGCVDIDDALSVYTLPNGNTQIGVRKLLS